jgi:hypothetical protein
MLKKLTKMWQKESSSQFHDKNLCQLISSQHNKIFIVAWFKKKLTTSMHDITQVSKTCQIPNIMNNNNTNNYIFTKYILKIEDL